MSNWAVQEAKARFSELLERSISDGPQLVTKRGEAAAMLVAVGEWNALQQRAKHSLKDVLLDPAGPKLDGFVLPERGRKAWRRAAPDDS